MARVYSYLLLSSGFNVVGPIVVVVVVVVDIHLFIALTVQYLFMSKCNLIADAVCL